VLVGRVLSDDVIDQAAAATVADARALTQNGYKIDLVKAATQEALRGLAS
jgi:hypothetical protein